MSEAEQLEAQAVESALEGESLKAMRVRDRIPAPHVVDPESAAVGVRMQFLSAEPVIETTAPTSYSGPVFDEFAAAAKQLRDSELAYKHAQERYRTALNALNMAVAPMPG